MTFIDRNSIDPMAIASKRIAIIGYGNQGRAQALNLKDGGHDVIVGLREDSPSRERAQSDGLTTAPPEQATDGADLVMLLVPDETMADVHDAILPQLAQGAALGFSHGLAIQFGLIEPRTDLDVILIAPKGPGSALRDLFVAGEGMVALVGVAQDASGSARDLALAYGDAIGCARAGLIESSFAEECEADLFNEGAVVWGAVPELLVAGFETLVEAGVAPEVAYLECVSELSLIAELIEQRGIAGMREAISNTAEMGAVLGGREIIDDGVRQRMRERLAEVKNGRIVDALIADRKAGYPALKQARAVARAHAIEAARRKLEL